MLGPVVNGSELTTASSTAFAADQGWVSVCALLTGAAGDFLLHSGRALGREHPQVLQGAGTGSCSHCQPCWDHSLMVLGCFCSPWAPAASLSGFCNGRQCTRGGQDPKPNTSKSNFSYGSCVQLLQGVTPAFRRDGSPTCGFCFSGVQENSSTKIENAAFTFPQSWCSKETVLTGALGYFLLGIFCSKLHKSAPLKNKSCY